MEEEGVVPDSVDDGDDDDVGDVAVCWMLFGWEGKCQAVLISSGT